MYGWRARLGVLVPSGIIAMEPEFALVTPEGVSCHYHRFKFQGGGRNEEILEDLKKADCVICGGSGRSMYSLNISMFLTGFLSSLTLQSIVPISAKLS